MMAHWALTVDTGPTLEPVTLTEAKAHLRVDHTSDDTLITALIVAAREQAEEFTNRAFIEQTLILTLDEFPCEIKLPRPKLIDVTGIEYIDGNGDTQTLETTVYRVDALSQPARITLEYAQVWPLTRDVTGAVTITYTAGYGDSADDVPQSIKQAILMLVATMYENRENSVVGLSVSEMPFTSQVLLQPYRVF